MYSAVAGAYCRCVDMAAQHATALLELAQAQKFDLWSAGATVVQGWAMARRGQAAEGVATI
jgi:hypothetical protein